MGCAGCSPRRRRQAPNPLRSPPRSRAGKNKISNGFSRQIQPDSCVWDVYSPRVLNWHPAIFHSQVGDIAARRPCRIYTFLIKRRRQDIVGRPFHVDNKPDFCALGWFAFNAAFRIYFFHSLEDIGQPMAGQNPRWVGC